MHKMNITSILHFETGAMAAVKRLTLNGMANEGNENKRSMGNRIAYVILQLLYADCRSLSYTCFFFLSFYSSKNNKL